MSLPAMARSLRVLVIDDDDVAREIMVDLLRQDGHDVWNLPSPIGATKQILSHEIQVVVIDVMMPSMRGDKLAALLTRNPKLKDLGVVLVTGATAAELENYAAEVNAAAVIGKGAMHEELLPAVRRSIKPRSTPSVRPKAPAR